MVFANSRGIACLNSITGCIDPEVQLKLIPMIADAYETAPSYFERNEAQTELENWLICTRFILPRAPSETHLPPSCDAPTTPSSPSRWRRIVKAASLSPKKLKSLDDAKFSPKALLRRLRSPPKRSPPSSILESEPPAAPTEASSSSQGSSSPTIPATPVLPPPRPKPVTRPHPPRNEYHDFVTRRRAATVSAIMEHTTPIIKANRVIKWADEVKPRTRHASLNIFIPPALARADPEANIITDEEIASLPWPAPQKKVKEEQPKPLEVVRAEPPRRVVANVSVFGKVADFGNSIGRALLCDVMILSLIVFVLVGGFIGMFFYSEPEDD